MKLAVSNIAWTNEEETQIAEALSRLGVKYVEIAPTKIWEDPTKATQKEIEAYISFWKKYGIEVVAFQSMLFTHPEYKLFESDENRALTLSYLRDFIVLAGKMGAKRMVFGSPKNRQKGALGDGEANTIAVDFFRALGDTGKENDVCFCIEPNATDYACDFVTTADAGAELVSRVDSEGFGLHLDIACMTLAGDDIKTSIVNARDILRHFHISSPMLGQVEEGTDVQHQVAANALKEISYDGFVSIEMRPGELGQNVANVEKAVRFAQNIYC